ncbi:MAG: hypothetical protein Q9170_002412 [Blastenia crenularia]
MAAPNHGLPTNDEDMDADQMELDSGDFDSVGSSASTAMGDEYLADLSDDDDDTANDTDDIDDQEPVYEGNSFPASVLAERMVQIQHFWGIGSLSYWDALPVSLGCVTSGDPLPLVPLNEYGRRAVAGWALRHFTVLKSYYKFLKDRGQVVECLGAKKPIIRAELASTFTVECVLHIVCRMNTWEGQPSPERLFVFEESLPQGLLVCDFLGGPTGPSYLNGFLDDEEMAELIDEDYLEICWPAAAERLRSFPLP